MLRESWRRSRMSSRWCAMPKGGTVTFRVEPRAVIEAVLWLRDRDPFAPGREGILIVCLTDEEKDARKAKHWGMVAEAERILIKWLRRGGRFAKENEPANLCLPKDLAKWLAGFTPPSARRGGLFGSAGRAKVPPSGMPVAAELFFFRCQVATTRRMGRPRQTPDQAARRLDAEQNMADSSWHRLTNRRDGKETQTLAGLLARLSIKTPDF